MRRRRKVVLKDKTFNKLYRKLKANILCEYFEVKNFLEEQKPACYHFLEHVFLIVNADDEFK